MLKNETVKQLDVTVIQTKQADTKGGKNYDRGEHETGKKPFLLDLASHLWFKGAGLHATDVSFLK